MNTVPTSTGDMLDLLMKMDPETLVAGSADATKRWNAACRTLMESQAGMRWFKLAMRRYNLVGTVFPADGNTITAAFRDGQRSVLSELLNAAAASVSVVDEEESEAIH